MIEITGENINKDKLINFVARPESGAIDVFIGTTRNSTNSKNVLKLEFESHEPMALKEIQKIIDQAFLKWTISKVAFSHRLGVVEIGEAAYKPSSIRTSTRAGRIGTASAKHSGTIIIIT